MTQSALSCLDDVLDQFVRNHASPSPEALAGYIAKYPEHREAIVAFVAVWSEQHFLQDDTMSSAPNEAALVESACLRFDAAMEERSAQRVRASAPSADAAVAAASQTLSEWARRAGFDLVDLAVPLDLDIGLVAKLDRRLIQAETLPRRLLDELARVLTTTTDTIRSILSAPPATAVPAFMIVRSAARSMPEPFADAVRASTLPEITKARWLSEAA